jgi:glycosyltransferase involved in cell wall biosynthesis
MKKSLTILVCAFNEAKNISNTLEKIFYCIKNRKDKQTKVKVVVVDDGSSDNTVSIVESISKKKELTLIENNTNIGMGGSIKKLIMMCDTDKITFVPGDNDLSEQLVQYSIDYAFKADVISFYLVNDELRGNVRYFISKFHNLLYCFCFNQYLIYFNGPKVLPVKCLKKVKLNASKFALIPEMSIKVMKMGVTFTEIPGERLNDDQDSLSLSFGSIFEAFYIFIFTLIEIYILKRKKYGKKSQRILTKLKVVDD